VRRKAADTEALVVVEALAVAEVLVVGVVHAAAAAVAAVMLVVAASVAADAVAVVALSANLVAQIQSIPHDISVVTANVRTSAYVLDSVPRSIRAQTLESYLD
jgi:hypothetical protein